VTSLNFKSLVNSTFPLWYHIVCPFATSTPTPTKVDFMRSGRQVCHTFCHCLSVCSITASVTSRSHWNLLLWYVPTNRKTWSTLVVNYHCGIQHFRRFIGLSHTVTGRFSRHSAKWLTPQGNKSTFWQRSGRRPDQNRDWWENLADVQYNTIIYWKQQQTCMQ